MVFVKNYIPQPIHAFLTSSAGRKMMLGSEKQYSKQYSDDLFFFQIPKFNKFKVNHLAYNRPGQADFLQNQQKFRVESMRASGKQKTERA